MTIGDVGIVVLASGLAWSTIAVCRRQLHRRPYRNRRLPWDGFMRLAQYVLVLITVCASLIAFPHPLAQVAILLALLMFVQAHRLRMRDQRLALADLIAVVASQGGFIPDAIDRFSRRTFGKVGQQARTFSHLLRCGTGAAESLRRSRLNLGCEAVSTIQAIEQPQSVVLDRGADSTFDRTDWLRSQTETQLAYLGILIALSMVVGAFVRWQAIVILGNVYPELWIESRVGYSELMHWAETITWVVVVLALAWGGLILLSKIFGSRFILYATPWYGHAVVSKQRRIGLRVMAHGMQQGRPIEGLLATAITATRSRWLKRGLRRVVVLLEQGQAFGVALKRAGLVHSDEAKLLSLAEGNGNAAMALVRIADDESRRYDIQWQLRLLWLVPTVTMLVGAFVLLHAYTMLSVLYGIVQHVA